MEKISICIVNYNTRQLLCQCIESIYSSTKDITFEIIVVDNDSTDDSCETIEKLFPSVKLIKNRVNVGFGRANNQAMRIARGEYILLLNSDTIVKPQALKRLASFMAKNPKVGLAGPRLLNEDGSVQASISNLPNLAFVILRMFRLRAIFPMKYLQKIAVRTNLFGSMVKSYLQVESTEPLKVQNISGACMMIRREAIEQVGMFDEWFFMYVEDIDLCKRIIDGGWEICFYPDAVVMHLVGKSSGGSFRDRSPISYDSLYYYFNKHHGRLYEMAVRLTVITALLPRVFFNVISHPVNTVKGTNQSFKQYSAVIARSLCL